MTRLEKLIEQLACDFGKITRWQVLCKEKNATTEDHQIELAEQVFWFSVKRSRRWPELAG